VFQGPGYVPAQQMGRGIQVYPGSHPVVLVIVLSVLFGGWAGMCVNRQVAKGLIFGLLGGIVFSVVTCGWGAIIWWPLTLIDAILIANRLNRGEPVREWQFF
jgi:hypothetical protein